MNINDLEICEIVELGNQIIGGATADVKVDAFAKQGKAGGKAAATAIGKYSNAQTKTGAYVNPYVSLGYAVGYAIAWNGKKGAYSTGYDKGYYRKK